jgi:anti-sigma regulatory factor (Ser/Thr protein kinase)
MQTVTSMQIPVDRFFDSALVDQTSRQIASELGFRGLASDEIVLAVAELASNILRHAGAGILTIRPLESGTGVGVEVECEFHGSSASDRFEVSHATSCGLGDGFGAVSGLMDEAEISSTPALGIRILCRRWLRANDDPAVIQAWQAGIASRPRRFATANGDAVVVHKCNGYLLAGVIDGLGHGEPAQLAALTAQTYLQAHCDMPFDKLFHEISKACRHTRGVVMVLARLDSPTVLTLANLGNIEMRPWTGTERLQIKVQRGFLGAGDDYVHVQRRRWDPEWVLVLHSDGLRTRWEWSDFPGLEREPPQMIANHLLSNLAKDDDDATVLVVKNPRVQP